MLTPLQAAHAAADAYALAPTWTGAGMNQSIHAVRSRVAGYDVIAFRGSKEPRDFYLDLRAWPHAIISHPQIGDVHNGMLDALLSIVPAMQADMAEGADVLVGHSLGADLALLGAAIAPRRPAAVFCFAPAPAFKRVPDWLRKLTRAWRNGNDPVTQEPPWFDQVDLIPIGAPDPVDPIRCHYMANYLAALSP